VTKTYDTVEVALFGWFDGEDECDPPEPDKRWMTLAPVEDDGSMGDEIATFVQRKRGGEYREDDAERVLGYAQLVLDAVRFYGEYGEYGDQRNEG
jgi:hypothetical protein